MSKHETNEFSHLVSQTLDSENYASNNDISNVIYIPCTIDKNSLKAFYPQFELKGVGFDFSGFLKESCGEFLPDLLVQCLVEKLGIPRCHLAILLTDGCYYLVMSKSRSDLAEALEDASAKKLAA